MTEREIKAADFIIRLAVFNGTGPETVSQQSGTNVTEVKKAAALLKEEGIIEIPSIGGWEDTYKLTAKGNRLNDSRIGMAGYLKEKVEKDKSQSEKAIRDDLHKDLQIEKLQIELNTLKDMQAEQRIFWQSGIDRDKRQRWQFWWTWIISGAALIMSALAFIKSIIIN